VALLLPPGAFGPAENTNSPKNLKMSNGKSEFLRIIIYMKKSIVFGFLDSQVLAPVITSPTASASVKRGARFTRMCLRRLDADGMARYYWSAIRGTGRSEAFSARLQAEGYTTFEDIIVDARRVFASL
jgi:hypothetical protein